MISYSDLIYHFTDIYLETAMECSICKENYTMADDNKFLDDFMKFFSSLILIIDNDERLDVSQLKEALTEKKEETLTAFHLFLKRQIAQEAIEYAMKNAQEGDIILLIGKGHEQYQEIKGVQYFWDEREAVQRAEEKFSERVRSQKSLRLAV